MARLYSNENFRLTVVEKLRGLGHSVVTSQQKGKANRRISDDQVLAYATQQGRAVLTLNRKDFIKLHNANPNHAGIVVYKDDRDSKALAQRIDAALRAYSDLHGQLVEVR